MSTIQINIKEARQRFSELVNAVALGRERVIITSRNKPKVVMVSLQDAEALKTDAVRKEQRQIHLESVKKLRMRLAKKVAADDSLNTLKNIREVRLAFLSNGN